MARYIHFDKNNALDTITEELIPVIECPVWYVHLRKNILGAIIEDTELRFSPIEYLPDLRDSTEPHTHTRKLVVTYRQLETGHTYPVVVAIQTARDTIEYTDCFIKESR